MRVLLVDPSASFMARLRRALSECVADVEVAAHDVEERGPPGPGFQWGLFDVALVGHELNEATTSVDWLLRYRDLPGFPPTVVLAERCDAYEAVRVMKAGAADLVLREDADAARLATILDEIERARSAAEVPAPIPSVEADATVVIRRDSTAVHDHTESTPEACPAGTGRGDGGYEFVRLIGHGGMSTVYLAKRNEDSQFMVLKMIEGTFARSPEMRARFLQEAELAASIESPRVVEILDYGFANNSGYICMEFFPMGDLKHRMEVGLDADEKHRAMVGIAEGVAAIGAAGIVHRDLKPGNVMFRADGSAAIADFGIAKRLDVESEMTLDGGVIGTPQYMSPEQICGESLDTRSDLFSAGVIFYHLLTGNRLYTGKSYAAVAHQIVNGPRIALPGAWSHYQPVVGRLLAKDPAERFADAGEVVTALGQVQK